MDVAIVSGRLTQVREDEVTLTDDEGTAKYQTELAQFHNQHWVVDNLGSLVQCKVVDGQIVEAELIDSD